MVVEFIGFENSYLLWSYSKIINHIVCYIGVAFKYAIFDKFVFINYPLLYVAFPDYFPHNSS